MVLHDVSDDRITFDVVVEVPKGSRNKYEWDPERKVLRLDRQLFTATRYPGDYGFLPETHGEDGDPLDALVILDEPTFPGCHIACTAVGMLQMSDEHGGDAKILAVPAGDPRVQWNDVGDVPEYLLREVRHFFDIYKDLEPGKRSVVGDWAGRADAEAEIAAAQRRFAARRS
jgi:inorganic pyrophosphatase